jgi:hypothetical protein
MAFQADAETLIEETPVVRNVYQVSMQTKRAAAVSLTSRPDRLERARAYLHFCGLH